MKLTKRKIDLLVRPATGAAFYWDEDLPGFGARVTPSRITYVAQGRVAGRTVRVTLGRHGPLTPDTARIEAKKRLGDMARGVDLNLRTRAERLAGVSLDEAFSAYLQARPLAPRTVEDYEDSMRVAFGSWRILPITKITGGMVRRRFEEISDRSRAQANQHFRFLRALLGWAMWRYGNGDGSPLIPENPCQILTKLKCWHRIDRRTGYVEPNQLKVFMDALVHQPGDSDGRTSAKDLCALLLLTGLREQEGCGLLWSDIDLNRRQITIRNPKNHRDHTLPIGKWLAKLIADRRTFARSSLYLFPAENKTGHLRHHHRQIVAIRRISGIKFRLHDLRRTFATIVTHDLERSFSAYTIKRLLNHSITGDVTAGYIQTPVETLREPMEMVERFILRSSGPLTDANVVRIRPTMGDELPKAATA